MENDIGLLWKYPDLTYEYIHKDVFNNFYYKTKDSIKKVVFDIKDEHKRRCPNGGCLGCSSKKADVFNAHFAREAVAIKIDELSSDLLLYGVIIRGKNSFRKRKDRLSSMHWLWR